MTQMFALGLSTPFYGYYMGAALGKAKEYDIDITDGQFITLLEGYGRCR